MFKFFWTIFSLGAPDFDINASFTPELKPVTKKLFGETSRFKDEDNNEDKI